jgi:hydrogenase maturation protein HypF
MAAQPARDQVNARFSPSGHEKPGHRCALVRVEGVVQGVGFRPYVYRLASELGLTGYVRNTSQNVTIVVGGPTDAVQKFISRLPDEAPPLARIHRMSVEDAPPCTTTRFEILESAVEEGRSQLVSPDVATCHACLDELLDSTDRRYRYPFTNCTNCGPRFTIITAMPYDRPNTTMSSFAMCPACSTEYADPGDRRFHAQPNACPVCGPAVSLLDRDGNEMPDADAISRTAALLDEGIIVALKGLGGFLLACDATAPEVVQQLRVRKRRPTKPFAVMVRDIETARRHCDLTAAEESLLLSPAAPIVLARWKKESTVCRDVAPGLLFLGIMLPYTPLHHLLVRACNRPLVMTSGNLSEEPIAAETGEALTRLHGIADYFLTHNRPIHSRYDDSVAMVAGGQTHLLRRARGYAPYPIELTFDSPAVLAVGPQTKNTFCLAEGHRAFVSQHIGDLDSVETLDHLEHTIQLYRDLFHIAPEVIAHDLHPDYASTAFAQRLATAPQVLRGVQHHHAHIVSCMVENTVHEPVIGIAFDGSGLGSDGHIWGGEFLVCDPTDSRRAGHLEYLPLPGGDAATLRPYRIAASYVTKLLGEQRLRQCRHIADVLHDDEWRVLVRQIETGFNTPLTSSMGRLFDAVAALAGVRSTIDYDGQAAIELEMQAHQYAEPWGTHRYAFGIEHVNGLHVVRVAPVLDAVLRDIVEGTAAPMIAAAFHEAVVEMAVDVATLISRDTGIRTVALSGGVFQNRILIEMTPERLRSAGFRVLTHSLLPSNDGCVSLGQAVVAARAG